MSRTDKTLSCSEPTHTLNLSTSQPGTRSFADRQRSGDRTQASGRARLTWKRIPVTWKWLTFTHTCSRSTQHAPAGSQKGSLHRQGPEGRRGWSGPRGRCTAGPSQSRDCRSESQRRFPGTTVGGGPQGGRGQAGPDATETTRATDPVDCEPRAVQQDLDRGETGSGQTPVTGVLWQERGTDLQVGG